MAEHCCKVMQHVIEHPVANDRGIKWQLMSDLKGNESLMLIYRCGGPYRTAGVAQIHYCPFCAAPISERPVREPLAEAKERG